MDKCKTSAGSPFIPTSGLNAIEMLAKEQIYECKICENCFSSPIQLTIHYVTLHRLLPCAKCLLLFLNRNDLYEHNKRQHANDDTNCSQCAMTFVTERALVAHLHDVHQRKYCEMCSSVIKCCATNTLEMHAKQVHKISTQINSSDAIFSFNNCTNGTFDCMICRQLYPNHRLFTHSVSFHKFSLGFIFGNILDKRFTLPLLKAVENADNVDGFDAKTVCTVCAHKFTPFAPKIIHRVYCNGCRVCRWCYSQFNDDKEFDVHITISASSSTDSVNLNVCKFCDSSNDRDHTAKRHNIDDAHCSQNTSDLFSVRQTSWIATIYSCNFCNEDLSANIQNIDSLIKHFVIHHKFSQNGILSYLKKSLVNSQRNDANEIKKRKLTFHEIDVSNNVGRNAGVVFDFDSKMVKVIYSSATDSDSSEAERSGDSQSTAARLKRPVYICTFCPFKTGVKCMLAMHLQHKHGFSQKIEDNRCNACKKIFPSYSKLQRHYNTVHHKVNANQYQCPFCAFFSKGKQKMRSHIAVHVESSYHPCSAKEIGFNCKYCHYSFWVVEKLNEHMFNRHSDKIERNFLMCSICAATFINKTCLRQHRDINHPTDRAFTSFLYQCVICYTTHVDISDIRMHMTEMHPKLRSIYCAEPQCRQHVADGNDSFQLHYTRFHKRKAFKCSECPKLFEAKVYAVKHYQDSHGDAKRLRHN